MSCSSLSLLFLISLHIHFLAPASGYFPPHQDCIPYDCRGQEISYPFRHNEQPDHCGFPGYELSCNGDHLTLSMESLEYQGIRIDMRTQIIQVARMDLSGDICDKGYINPTLDFSLFNTTLDFSLFNSTSGDLNPTLFYACNSSATPGSFPFSCHASADPPQEPCNFSVLVPISPIGAPGLPPPPSEDGDDSAPNSRAIISMVLSEGFEINWIVNTSQCKNCIESGGRCGYGWRRQRFDCFCPAGVHSTTCDQKRKSKTGIKIGIGFGSAAGTLAVMMIAYFIHKSRQRKKSEQPFFVSRSMSSIDSSRTDVEQGSFYYGVPIFDYEELKKATNNFDPAEELGDGGFGTVFKGKLRDGRVVAVKRLYESNYKRVEQFMNEVEILTRLRHRNLVSLYGYTSRQSPRLLLVYEYVPNGTVADHINGELAKPGLPPWSTRLNIAMETANALVYLHASDVIHRDVKTNNILLDENFSVKVADFGLSRLFPLDATHVSTAPQGTPGYVDPEYHQCYQLTEKSDVYSFGVVLMELISSLPAVDITRHRHEINLSALAMSKIQSDALDEFVDQNLGFHTDYRTRKMITAVAELGFRCLQQGHEMRPSMIEVLETLKDIQNCSHDMEKMDKMDNPAEEAVLLKNNPLTLSPDSVTAKWVSSDTPHASG